MEGSQQYLMWMKRKQALKAHLEVAPQISWEERAFAEDVTRLVGGSMWPPRCYSCNFCKREFRSAQALGGHMNVHRRDRARLKHNNNNHHDHHNDDVDDDDCKKPSSLLLLGTQIMSPSKLEYCCLNDVAVIGCGQHDNETPYSHSSSITRGSQKTGCPNSEPGSCCCCCCCCCCCNDSVETCLSVGLKSSSSSMFGQRSSSAITVLPCENEAILSCKRLKTSGNISSLKPCSEDNRVLAMDLPSAEMVEDLDLELRLGKQQKLVK